MTNVYVDVCNRLADTLGYPRVEFLASEIARNLNKKPATPSIPMSCVAPEWLQPIGKLAH